MRKDSIIRILFVVSSMGLVHTIQRESRQLGILAEIVFSTSEILELVMRDKYHGIVVESCLLAKIKKEDRPGIERYREVFFFSRIQYYPHSKSVTIFTEDDNADTDFARYVEKASKEIPRQFRVQTRKPISFNVDISKMKKGSKVFHTHTKNVSEGGCFIYTTEKFIKGGRLKVVFKELRDKTPIICRIVWKTNGGSHFKIPGVGLFFEEITDKQLQEIHSVLLW